MLGIFLFLVFGMFSPFLLWPIEHFLPYPYIIEELFKLSCIIIFQHYGSLKRFNLNKKIIFSITFALLFTLTESILYLMNLFMLNQLNLFPKRLILTGSMHTLSIIFITIGVQKSWFWRIILFGSAVLLHYYYNKLAILL